MTPTPTLKPEPDPFKGASLRLCEECPEAFFPPQYALLGRMGLREQGMIVLSSADACTASPSLSAARYLLPAAVRCLSASVTLAFSDVICPFKAVAGLRASLTVFTLAAVCFDAADSSFELVLISSLAAAAAGFSLFRFRSSRAADFLSLFFLVSAA